MVRSCWILKEAVENMMGKKLLIIGAGIYSLVAAEIAADMDEFDQIDFVDDVRQMSPNGKTVLGTTKQLNELLLQYHNVVVAIGNSTVRMNLLFQLKQQKDCEIISLISPKAYVSPTATIGVGCIIEPMAVVHSNCVLEDGCFVSAGAVINHESRCCRCVHVDCHATVVGKSIVPEGTKIDSGDVYPLVP
jgi:UDP-3-O-[3-hydroxymyristoyl] glucosamine N-acyltransferase